MRFEDHFVVLSCQELGNADSCVPQAIEETLPAHIPASKNQLIRRIWDLASTLQFEFDSQFVLTCRQRKVTHVEQYNQSCKVL